MDVILTCFSPVKPHLLFEAEVLEGGCVLHQIGTERVYPPGHYRVHLCHSKYCQLDVDEGPIVEHCDHSPVHRVVHLRHLVPCSVQLRHWLAH